MNDSVARNTMSAGAKGSKTPVTIKTLGIIGGGQMGNGIAHVAALAGFDVAVMDVSEEALKRSLATIDKNMARQVQKGAISDADKKSALGRIKTGTSLSLMGDRDLIIEAATE